MLIDFLLILGAFFGAFGIMKILAQINNRASPLSGVLIVIVGVSLLYIAQILLGESLTPRDIPDALFRIIGQLN
tara:strand:- start:1274 stop:1495 length:222 start_codon:yes stop_codon:yes gene_type:complete